MRSVWHLLVIFSVIALNACAFGMGRNRCGDSVPLPIRPAAELCISSGSGSGGCFDPRHNPNEYILPTMVNYTCTNPVDYTAQEEWIKNVMKACK